MIYYKKISWKCLTASQLGIEWYVFVKNRASVKIEIKAAVDKLVSRMLIYEWQMYPTTTHFRLVARVLVFNFLNNLNNQKFWFFGREFKYWEIEIFIVCICKYVPSFCSKWTIRTEFPNSSSQVLDSFLGKTQKSRLFEPFRSTRSRTPTCDRHGQRYALELCEYCSISFLFFILFVYILVKEN